MRKSWQVVIPCLILISWLVTSIPGTALAKDFSRTLTIPTDYTNGSAAGKIAFVSGFPVTEGSNTSEAVEICVINADGSGQIRLTNSKMSVRNEHPAWSPDGTRIAFKSTRDRGYESTFLNEIYVMNADGSNQIRLTDNPYTDENPAWSPDGKRIVFDALRDETIFNYASFRKIYLMNADGSNVTRLSNPGAKLTRSDFYEDTDPAWSPDGRQIAFVSDRKDNNHEIYVMNADGTNVRRLTNNPTADFQPAWSPDGTKIAFTHDRGYANYEIYVMNANGTNQRRLTDGYYPAWSSDSTKIAFYTERDGTHEIYLMNADGTGQTQLTYTVPDWHPDWDPSWSPDDTRIVFVSDRDGADRDYRIYVMNADGSNQTRLTNNLRDFHPVWSPDGAKIVFQSDRDGNWEIYVMNADGTNQRRLTFSPGLDADLAWFGD